MQKPRKQPSVTSMLKGESFEYNSDSSIRRSPKKQKQTQKLLIMQQQDKEIASLKLSVDKLFQQQKSFSDLLQKVVSDTENSNITVFRDKVSMNFIDMANKLKEFEINQQQQQKQQQQFQENTSQKTIDIQKDIMQIMQEVIKVQERGKRNYNIAQKIKIKQKTDFKITRRMLKKCHIFEFYLQGGNGPKAAQTAKQKQSLNFNNFYQSLTGLQQTTNQQSRITNQMSNNYGNLSEFDTFVHSVEDQFEKISNQFKEQQLNQEKYVNENIKQTQNQIQIINVQLQKQQKLNESQNDSNLELLNSQIKKYKQIIQEQTFQNETQSTNIKNQVSCLEERASRQQTSTLDELQKIRIDIITQGAVVQKQQSEQEQLYSTCQDLQKKICNNTTLIDQVARQEQNHYEEFQIFTGQQKIYQYFIKIDDMAEQADRFKLRMEDGEKNVKQYIDMFHEMSQSYNLLKDQLQLSNSEKDKLVVVINNEMKLLQRDMLNMQQFCNLQTLNDLIDNKVITNQSQIQTTSEQATRITGEIQDLRQQLVTTQIAYQSLLNQEDMYSKLGTRVANTKTLKLNSLLTQQQTSQQSKINQDEKSLNSIQLEQVDLDNINDLQYKKSRSNRNEDDTEISDLENIKLPKLDKVTRHIQLVSKRVRQHKIDQDEIAKTLNAQANEIAKIKATIINQLQKHEKTNSKQLDKYLSGFQDILVQVESVNNNIQNNNQQFLEKYNSLDGNLHQMEIIKQQVQSMQKQFKQDISSKLEKQQTLLEQQQDIQNKNIEKLNNIEKQLQNNNKKQIGVDQQLQELNISQELLKNHKQMIVEQNLTIHQLNQSNYDLTEQFGKLKQQQNQYLQQLDQIKQFNQSIVYDVERVKQDMQQTTIQSSQIVQNISQLQKMDDLLQGKVDFCNAQLDAQLQAKYQQSATQSQLNKINQIFSSTDVFGSTAKK